MFLDQRRVGVAVVLLMLGLASQVHAQAALPTAEQTDPVKLGWMVGSPPPPD